LCCFLLTKKMHTPANHVLSLALPHKCAYGLILADLAKHFILRTKIIWNKYIWNNLAIHINNRCIQ
jgi:hypothetical protein